jgi:hypothetical protein
MLQRIQTVYLAIVFILTGILPFVFPLWKTIEGKDFYFMNVILYQIVFGLSTTLA